jgi:hypothetical protein
VICRSFVCACGFKTSEHQVALLPKLSLVLHNLRKHNRPSRIRGWIGVLRWLVKP